MKGIRILLAAPFLAVLYVYRWVISPGLHLIIGPLGGGCRFQPTCSRYAIEALKTFPLHRALWLIVRRVGRCHPWGGEGYDPLPPRVQAYGMHVYASGTEGGPDQSDHKSQGTDTDGDNREPEKKDQHEGEECQTRQTDE